MVFVNEIDLVNIIYLAVHETRNSNIRICASEHMCKMCQVSCVPVYEVERFKSCARWWRMVGRGRVLVGGWGGVFFFFLSSIPMRDHC